MTGPFTEQPKNFSVNARSSLGKLKFWLISGGVLLLVFISLGVWFLADDLMKDDIAELTPIDSVFYLTGRDSLLPWQTKVEDIPIINFFGEASKPIDRSMRISYALVINQANQLEPIYFFKSDHLVNFKSNDFDFEHSAKIGKILVVAKSGEVLNRIIEVKENKTFSLATVMNKKNYNQVNFYLSSRNLKEYLKQFTELHYQLLGKIIDQDVYGGMNKKGDHWIFEVVNSTKSFAGESQIDSLPSDFKIFISGLNLLEVFQSWGRADENIAQAFLEVAGNFGAIYDFNVVASIYDLINQPVDLILFEKSAESMFNFDYVLVSDLTNEDQVIGLKKLVGVVLAQKFPREVLRILPDRSTVIELQASPGDWEWQIKKIDNDSTINYVSEPRINFSFAYLVKDNKLFVSNSSLRLEQFFESDQTDLAALTSCGISLESGSSMVFNRDQKLFDYTLDWYIVMNQFDGQNIQGCFSQ